MASSPFGGQTLKVLEGANVFADGAGKVLRLHETHILPARVTQDVTESMHTPLAFGRERNVVRGVVHLRLLVMVRVP